MGWFKKLIPGSKSKETKGIGAMLPMPAYGRVNPELLFSENGNHYGVDWTAALPQNVMQKIFEYVCPHTMDESYTCNEESAEEMGCMLCNMRDLSHCVLVCKRWRKFAVPVLYRSIRIDSVHYCALQDSIDEREERQNKSKYGNKNPGTIRTGLLARTLRDDTLGLGTCILLLKLPYMVRESCKPDLARIASVAPNLRYIDLPDGLFSGDASSATLRQELENRCPDIRKMTYNAGTEKQLESLASLSVWPNLEVLTLNRLTVDPNTLRYVFGALQNLQELTVKDMPIFSDLVFSPTVGSDVPPFPPVTSLIIESCPKITAQGLTHYLSNPIVSATLQSLSLTETGVQPQDVHSILSEGQALQHFSIIDDVNEAFPTHLQIPPLKNRNLHTLHFEITAQVSATYTAGTAAYHAYLASSLLGNNLPSLRELYVRDNDFPVKLTSGPAGNGGLGSDLVPPMPGFMGEAPPPRPFAGRGTAANRDSVASNYTAFGSPPTKSGFQPALSDSPEHKGGNRDSFVPSSFSPPKTDFGNMSQHQRRESHLSLHNQQQNLMANAQRRERSRGPEKKEGLKNPLVVYTKGLDEMEWAFSEVQPSRGHGRGASVSGARPISMVGIAGGGFGGAGGGRGSGIFGETWAPPGGLGTLPAAGGYRSSVILPNGFGGVIQREVEPGMEGSKTGNKVSKKNMSSDLF